jgi:hypothetical protein
MTSCISHKNRRGVALILSIIPNASSQNNFLIYTLCINFAIAFHVTKIIPWLHACIIYGIPYQFRDFIPCHANDSATIAPPSRILHGPSVLASVLLRRRRLRPLRQHPHAVSAVIYRRSRNRQTTTSHVRRATSNSPPPPLREYHLNLGRPSSTALERFPGLQGETF